MVRNSGNGELRLDEVILSDSNASEIQNVAVNSGYVGIAQPSTPFLINGYVFYENDNECNNPIVNITNLDTGGEWTAKTIENSNYYQIMLASADIVEGETLQFNVVCPDGSQSAVTEHTVIQDEINDGGLFDYNVTLVALNNAPVADPSGPYTGTEGTEIAFDGSASSDPDRTIDSYNWDFGDGNSGTGVSPVHTYVQDGTYTVTLTVTDNDGAMDSDSTIVVVGNIAPTVTIHSPASITNDSTPLLHATFDQSAATWYVIDGTAGTGGFNTDNLTVTLPQLADAQHTVKVYANNSDGYVGFATLDFFVDTKHQQ